MRVLIIMSLVLLLPATAQAHRPSKHAARSEALMSAEDALRVCRGSVSVRKPLVRFVGVSRHTRTVEVTNLDGYLEAFTWLVVVGHADEAISVRNIGATVPQVCR